MTESLEKYITHSGDVGLEQKNAFSRGKKAEIISGNL